MLTTAAAFAVCGSAYAADMSVKAPGAPLAPVYSWTGFYGGLQAGYASMNGSCSQTDTVGFLGGGLPCFFNPSFNSNGAIAGVRGGYDWQSGAFVVGVVGDFNLTSLKWTQVFNTAVLESGSAGYGSLKLDWLASVRGRVGWAIDPNWLVYGTGGFAWGQFDAYSNLQGTCCGNWWARTKTTKSGVVAGGGIEYKLSPHASIFAEGLWYGNFGSVDNSRFCPGTSTSQQNTCFATGTYTTSFKVNDIVTAAVGMNYRF